MTPAVAIIGLACRYPEARTPTELWENVLAQRRAFRRMPPERLRLEDYLDKDPNAPDRTYVGEAALITDYEFDRVRYRVAGTIYRSADLAHWLALDIAAQALADAGYPEGEGLPKETTGVLLGNTLTGEFSRANTMRLRWPYVRRVMDAALAEAGWRAEQRKSFLSRLEASYKNPFAPVGEETLAGSLSNTIAGRICNHFDLKGGGYTIDGACAASLLAMAHACSALASGDLDVVLAGGVDLSLDPFELVGFAKAGALAPEEMRVYDLRSSGFWPGEGCGFVLLMRYEDALAARRRIYAVIRGWGISSDGRGGITRPEVEGQLLALRRAYRRADFGIDTVTYFEGHGTGTSVGDSTELEALSGARHEAGNKPLPAVIGSIKANIGHTKAAAGVAGIIKTTMALHNQILPPTTGCENPHPKLNGSSLEILKQGKPWPNDRPLRAGVSAMGFGGINTHVVLEGAATERRKNLSSQEQSLLSSAQDAELFLIGADHPQDLIREVERLLAFALRLSRSELTDLAVRLEGLLGNHKARVAIVASSPAELGYALKKVRSCLETGVSRHIDPSLGIFLSTESRLPRIGFLFPGQGSPVHLDGGAWSRRFHSVRELYEQVAFPAVADLTATEVAQPAIAIASLAALRVLKAIGIQASIALGHSLGEITALHWAGAIDEDTLLRIAFARGKAMAELANGPGAMASIAAGPREVEALLEGFDVVIAGFNSPRQTVVSGAATAVARILERASQRSIKVVGLPVSHAFHSPLVAPAVGKLAEELSRENFKPLERQVISTVTALPLSKDDDLRQLLYRQVTAPVRFAEAVSIAASDLDLFIEVGSGEVLSGLVSEFLPVQVLALDAGGSSLRGLLSAVGSAFVLGAPVNHQALFAGRFARPFDLDWRPKFFVNPCELAPLPEDTRDLSVICDDEPGAEIHEEKAEISTAEYQSKIENPKSAIELIRGLVAERAELPLVEVKESSRLLGDLHLNSISVAQIVAEASKQLGMPPPVAPTEFAHATVEGIARALEELAHTGVAERQEKETFPAGIDSWIDTFTVDLIARPLHRRSRSPSPAPLLVGERRKWQLVAAPDHPLRQPLQRAFNNVRWGIGVVVCLPPEPDERHLGLLLQGARIAVGEQDPSYFVVLQHGWGGSGFARTLHLEHSEITTCVVNVPEDHPKAIDWIVAEVEAAQGFVEVYYDISGRRHEPILIHLPLNPEKSLPLGSEDVLLVTGGGKGIAAECALSLARETGVQLALLGRSKPDTDPDLAANLDRIAAFRVRCRYFSVDVTDTVAVQRAIAEIEEALGPVSAILHGAGTNRPQLLDSLDEDAFFNTLRPKTLGALNVLKAVNPDRLKLFVAFSSIIARTGMAGEADYALANEWLSHLTERWKEEHPHCRCLAIEWSVWSGVGMGERLGRVEALARQGITAITPDKGVAVFRRLLACSPSKNSVVVSGRFPDVPTLNCERPDLPLLRFLEQTRVFFPGIELIVDAELSAPNDPYVEDHIFRGERLFPAVMGLEAMAQVAMALGQTAEHPTFEEIKFARPIVVPPRSQVTIRLAALVGGKDRIEVVVRSSESFFQIDHFRATCRFGAAEASPRSNVWSKIDHLKSKLLTLDAGQDLYGKILFQSGRFARLHGYYFLTAKECLVEITPDGTDNWFGHYLPQKLVLGDPGARDTMIHSIQACIPHGTLLPTGVDRITFSSRQFSDARFGYAKERSRDGDNFVYDLEIMDANGRILEQWEGLQLRKIGDIAFAQEWPSPLIGPYVERRFRELIPGAPISLVLMQNGLPDERQPTEQATQQLLGKNFSLLWRPDGKPEVAAGNPISVAHCGRFTLAVSSPTLTGCDFEPVTARPSSLWRDLIGAERFPLAEIIARETGECEDSAATRVWTACECLKKVGSMADTPLVLESVTKDGWTIFGAGSQLIASFVGPLKGFDRHVGLAILVQTTSHAEGADAGL